MSVPTSRLSNLPEYSLSAVAQKIHHMRREGIDVVDCTQINPSIPPPQLALDIAVQEMLKPHNHKYSISIGTHRLRQAFASYYTSTFNADVSDKDVIVTSGTKEAIGHLLFSILQAGDTVLVPIPSYPIHTAAISLAGAGFVGVPLWESYQDQCDSEGILTGESEFFFSNLENQYFSTWPRPKCILTAFPHNPTTTIVDSSFYQRLLDFSKRNECWVINDFAHGDLYYSDTDRVSLMSVARTSDPVLEVYSLSKGYNLGGWRIGAAVGSSELTTPLSTIKSYLDFGTLAPLQHAAASLLEHELSDGYTYRNSVLETYKDRRSLFHDIFSEAGWKTLLPKATPFLWLETQGVWSEHSAADFANQLLEKCRLGVYEGSGFDPRLEGYVRISLIEPTERVRSIAASLSSFLKSGTV